MTLLKIYNNKMRITRKNVTDLASGLRFSKRHTKDFEAFRNKRLSEFDRAISFKKQKSRRNRYEMDSDIEKDHQNFINDFKLLKEFASSNNIYNDNDYFIVNNFIKSYEEQDLFNDDCSNNLAIEQVKNKIFYNEGFRPGLFSSLNPNGKFYSIIYESLGPPEDNLYLYDTKTFSSNSNDDIITNNSILNLCLQDKNIFDEKIILKPKKMLKVINNSNNLNNMNTTSENRDDMSKSESKSSKSSSSEEEEDLKEAVFDYENGPNMIITRKSLFIEKQNSFTLYPPPEEEMDHKSFDFFYEMSEKIDNYDLKNRIKLILDMINYIEPESQKPIFTNKIKNSILALWKEKYIKQAEMLEIELRKKIIRSNEEKMFINKFNEIKRGLLKKHNTVKQRSTAQTTERSKSGNENVHNNTSSKLKKCTSNSKLIELRMKEFVKKNI